MSKNCFGWMRNLSWLFPNCHRHNNHNMTPPPPPPSHNHKHPNSPPTKPHKPR